MTGRVGYEERAVEVLTDALPVPLFTRRDNEPADVDQLALAQELVQALSDAGLVIVAREDVLSAGHANVLLRGVVGWDEEMLDRQEALHDEAMEILKRLSGASDGGNEDG